MSLFDSLFKAKTNTTTLEPMLTDEQKQAMSSLSTYGQTGKLGDFNAGQEYGGSLGEYTLSPEEQQIRSGTMDLINRGSQGGQASRSALMDMLNNEFNPSDPSTGYAAYARQANRAFQGGLDAINRDAAISGDRFSTSVGRDKTDLAAQQGDILASKLAEIYNQSENRRFGAAGTMLQDEAQQIQNIQNAQQIAALERNLKNAEASAKYNEFLRQRNERLGSIGALSDVMNKNVDYGMKEMTTKSPSTFMSMLGEVSPLAGSYNTHKYGYTTNQSSLADATEIIKELMTQGGA